MPLGLFHWAGFLLTVGAGAAALIALGFGLWHLENVASRARVDIRETVRRLERGMLVIVVVWGIGAALGAAELIVTPAG